MNAPLPPHVTAPSVPAEAERTASASAPADTAALLDEPAPRAWYRRPVLWVVAALIAIAAAGAGYWQTSRQASEAPRYTTEPARRGNITLTVTANGTLQPTRSIAIGSELSGTVSKVNVDVNDRVKKGQVLVELDTAKLKDQILRSRAIERCPRGVELGLRRHLATGEALHFLEAPERRLCFFHRGGGLRHLGIGRSERRA